MILKCSPIVIIILIANLSFLYHKSEKPAAEYLLQVARASEGRRYRRQPKIDALRQHKEEILEAHRWAASAAVKGEKPARSKR